MDNENGFNYSYSAREQDEVKTIRDKYLPDTKSEDKLQRLRRLDGSVSTLATAASLAVGITGALVMGFGMSVIMTELSAAMGLSGELALALGIPIGSVGLILLSLAYPVYNLTVKLRRKKIAPEVLALTEELMK